MASSAEGRRKWIVYGLLYCSYMLYYFNKKNYGYFIKNLMEETGASRAEIGALASSMELAGFLTSLFNGVLVDRYSPVLILAGMLAVAAASNALMCFTDSVPLMTVLWGVNGFAQAFGWPCMAKVFMNWFPDPSERGKLYSILSTCQNVGTALVPIVLLPLMNEAEAAAQAGAGGWNASRLGGWRVAMSFPAACGFVYAAVLATFVPSSPPGAKSGGSAGAAKKPRAGTAAGAASAAAADSGGVGSVMHEVVSSTVVWKLAVCYLGIGIVRDFYSNWGPNFLEEAYSGAGLAKSEVQSIIKQAISWQQAGGFVGTVIAGFLTDVLFGGRRCPVIAILTLAICPISLFALYAPSEIVLAVPYTTFFLLGCCFTTPHVLIGLAARELTLPHAASSAGGFVAAMSKLGSASAGAPVGRLMDEHGTDGALALLGACGLVGGVSTLTLWNATPPEEEDRKIE